MKEGGTADAFATRAADHQRNLGPVLEIRHLRPDVVITQMPYSAMQKKRKSNPTAEMISFK